MASQSNRVDLQINAQVSGQQQIQTLVAALRELMGLIRGAGGGVGWLGPSPITGAPATAYAQELLAGMPALGGVENRARFLTAVLDVSKARAAQLGIHLAPPMIGPATVPAPALPVTPSLPGPVGMGYVFGPGFAGWPGAGGYLPGPSAGPVSYPPIQMGMLQARPPVQMALPPYSGYGVPGLPGGVLPPGGGGLAPPTGGGFPPMFAPVPAGDLQQAAQKAKPATGHMLWGLMFQAFFGVLFGGLQEYMQAARTGVPSPAGWATMMPSILNLAGMGIGLATGNIGLTLGLGMAGQLAGMPIAAGAAGKALINQTTAQYMGMFGRWPTTETAYGPKQWDRPVNWLQALVLNLGWTAERQAEISLGRLTGLPPEQQSWARAQFLRPGEDITSEGFKGRLGRWKKLAQNPFLEEYYQLTPRRMIRPAEFEREEYWTASLVPVPTPIGPVPVPIPRRRRRLVRHPAEYEEPHYDITKEGIYATYWEGGMDAALEYAAAALPPIFRPGEPLAPFAEAPIRKMLEPLEAGRRRYTRAMFHFGGEAGRIEARMGYQAALGSSAGYLASQQALSNNLAQQQNETMRRLTQALRTDPGGKATQDLISQLNELNISRSQLILNAPQDWPLPPELQFTTTALETAIMAGSRLGAGWGRYRKELGFTLRPIDDPSDNIWAGLSGRSLRQNMKALIGNYGRAIQEFQLGYEAELREAERMTEINYPDLGPAYDAALIPLKREIGAKFQLRADPYRRAIIGLVGQMQTGWMERLVAEEWGMPAHAARIARTFNYAGAGAAYEGRFGESQRYFGGRMGMRGVRTLAGITDAQLGRGGAIAEGLANVNVTINVVGGELINKSQAMKESKDYATSIVQNLA